MTSFQKVTNRENDWFGSKKQEALKWRVIIKRKPRKDCASKHQHLQNKKKQVNDCSKNMNDNFQNDLFFRKGSFLGCGNLFAGKFDIAGSNNISVSSNFSQVAVDCIGNAV